MEQLGIIILENIKNVSQYIINPELISPVVYNFIQVLKVIFVSISIVLMVIIGFLLSVNSYFNYRFTEKYTEKYKGRPYTGIKKIKNWQEIKMRARKNNEEDRKVAIMDADDAIYNILDQYGYTGETIEEKLKEINNEILPNIDKIREVHQKRNEIVRNPNKKLSSQEATDIILAYEETARYLYAL